MTESMGMLQVTRISVESLAAVSYQDRQMVITIRKKPRQSLILFLELLIEYLDYGRHIIQ